MATGPPSTSSPTAIMPTPGPPQDRITSFGAVQQMPGNTTSTQSSTDCPISNMMNGGSLQNSAFPVKLHAMLSEIEQTGHHSNVVSWRPHGRLFMVHDRKRFIQEVLPCWFLQSRFESFQRQLNMYGFARITAGPDRGGYYHEMFLRGHPQLAKNIPRQKRKGTGHRKPANPETEPNFYAMPPVASAATRVIASPPCTSPRPPNSAPQNPKSAATTELSLGKLLLENPSVLRNAIGNMTAPTPVLSSETRVAHPRFWLQAVPLQPIVTQPTSLMQGHNVDGGLDEILDLFLGDDENLLGNDDVIGGAMILPSN